MRLPLAPILVLRTTWKSGLRTTNASGVVVPPTMLSPRP